MVSGPQNNLDDQEVGPSKEANPSSLQDFSLIATVRVLTRIANFEDCSDLHEQVIEELLEQGWIGIVRESELEGLRNSLQTLPAKHDQLCSVITELSALEKEIHETTRFQRKLQEDLVAARTEQIEALEKVERLKRRAESGFLRVWEFLPFTEKNSEKLSAAEHRLAAASERVEELERTDAVQTDTLGRARNQYSDKAVIELELSREVNRLGEISKELVTLSRSTCGGLSLSHTGAEFLAALNSLPDLRDSNLGDFLGRVKDAAQGTQTFLQRLTDVVATVTPLRRAGTLIVSNENSYLLSLFSAAGSRPGELYAEYRAAGGSLGRGLTDNAHKWRLLSHAALMNASKPDFVEKVKGLRAGMKGDTVHAARYLSFALALANCDCEPEQARERMETIAGLAKSQAGAFKRGEASFIAGTLAALPGDENALFEKFGHFYKLVSKLSSENRANRIADALLLCHHDGDAAEIMNNLIELDREATRLNWSGSFTLKAVAALYPGNPAEKVLVLKFPVAFPELTLFDGGRFATLGAKCGAIRRWSRNNLGARAETMTEQLRDLNMDGDAAAAANSLLEAAARLRDIELLFSDNPEYEIGKREPGEIAAIAIRLENWAAMRASDVKRKRNPVYWA